MKKLQVVLIVLLTLLVCLAAAKDYKVVTGDKANVVFSSNPMSKGEEDSWTDVRNTFTWGEDDNIYARCYWPKTYEEIWNDVQKTYPGSVEVGRFHRIEIAWGSPTAGTTMSRSGKIKISSTPDWDWNQCNGYPILPSEFYDLNIAEWADTPGTHTVTYQFYVEIGMNWDSWAGDYGHKEEIIISEGSFDFIVP